MATTTTDIHNTLNEHMRQLLEAYTKTQQTLGPILSVIPEPPQTFVDPRYLNALNATVKSWVLYLTLVEYNRVLTDAEKKIALDDQKRRGAFCN